MLTLLAALALQGAACPHDRTALLALDERAFDQDMAGGWRPLAAAGCEAVAADLIRDWRAARPAALDRPWLSFWHEGQLRALAGQTARAIALFRLAYRPPGDAAPAWNRYVDGSIAFLRRDRRGLDRARARLAALPDPMNIDVLDGLARCWGASYRRAYPCPVPAPRRD